jgi:hypothetical protein
LRIGYGMMNVLVVKQESRNNLNTEIEKDDNSWLDEFDSKWDEEQRLWDIEIKKKIEKCNDLLDRILLKNGIVFIEEDDTIQSFVQYS